MMESVKAKFGYFIFQNESTNYGIGIVETMDGTDDFVITGPIMSCQKGETYDFVGQYVNHEKYGLQFAVSNFQLCIDDPYQYLVNLFSSEQFKGIGKKTATQLVEYYGENIIDELSTNPGSLTELGFLNEKKVEAILKGLENFEANQVDLFLNSLHLTSRQINLLKQNYLEHTVDVLKTNPYRVVYEIQGIGFATADKIGKALGVAGNDERRIAAHIYSLLQDYYFRSGHTVQNQDIVLTYLRSKRVYDVETIHVYLEKMLAQKYLHLDGDLLYLSEQWRAEKNIADFLAVFPYFEISKTARLFSDEEISQVEQTLNISYDPTQKQAIQNFFNNDLSILTGGPGTGKTTVVKGIVEIIKAIYPTSSVMLCAPTGRAAKRLSEVCGCEASTIHSLLKWNLETNVFQKNGDDPIDCDILIIDEFSMVDNVLFSNLLIASRNVKKMLLIGDEDQLPSILPGALLRDLLNSKCIPSIELAQIFRQSEGSGIISLAHQIKYQQPLKLRNENSLMFIPCSVEQIPKYVQKLVDSAITKGYGFADFQILTPMYKGLAGIDYLNDLVQEVFNPSIAHEDTFVYGTKKFRKKDKVIQLKNQASEDVFNGDLGIVSQVVYQHGAKDNYLLVDYDANEMEYDYDNLMQLRLAYAISIHKSQGSEYPIVILPISNEHATMLDKKLLYTAITRAKKSLIVVGDLRLFEAGLQRAERAPRKTHLIEQLLQKFDEYQ